MADHEDFLARSAVPSATPTLLDVPLSSPKGEAAQQLPKEKSHLPPASSFTSSTPDQGGYAPPVMRAKTIELAGTLSVVREGRGDAFGEPLECQKTREEIVYLEWAEGDVENPFNFPKRQKWAIVVTCITITALTALNATAYSSGYESAHDAFGVSSTEWVLGNTLYFIAIALTPLALAPLSEVFGRNTIYLVTSALSAILFIPQATTPAMSGILGARWFQGMMSSVGNSMVGGTVADLFEARERGFAMSLYSVWVFVGQSLGPVAFGYLNLNLGFRWMFWIQAIIGGISFLINCFVLVETRGSTLLSRRAEKLTELTGKLHAAPGDKEKGDLGTLLRVSLTRPIIFLFTEPIVAGVSLWVAFVWGTLFLFIQSASLIFEQYNFNLGEIGLALLSIGVGGILGFIANYLVQDRLYLRAGERAGGKPEPEARLYLACVGSLMFPIGMFWYGWTGTGKVHWASPVVALVFTNTGIFMIYSGVFNFFADAYERYSSSAQASQSLLRNIFAAVFPLFAKALYRDLGYPYASTLLACIAVVLGFCPFLLMFYGKKLRARSKIATALKLEADLEDAARVERLALARGKAEARLVADEGVAGEKIPPISRLAV